ncbi:MAG: xanthine dehydrogenase family protein subunit M [Candidatus Marinimicrobia bacterium]|nr:xanthine dehydrogenase family protein subunit M [Candidatus Neomarinimicrobiota bacterium]
MKYFAPNSMDELKTLFQTNENGSVLAGGTDVLPRWQDNPKLKPDVLIDIKKIKELSGIRESENEIIIGPLTTVQEIKKSKIIQTEFSALTEAASQFGGVQICHRATIGGNICNASPAGDLLPGLYAHNANIGIMGPNGNRSMSISDFIIGVGKTALEKGEIVSEIHLPRKGEKSLFYKLGLRQSMAIAVVNFAIAYEKDNANNLKSLTIAAGSVAPTIVYLESLTNAIMNGENLDGAIQLVDEDISPIDDIRTSGAYRSTALKNVLKHTIKEIYVR